MDSDVSPTTRRLHDAPMAFFVQHLLLYREDPGLLGNFVAALPLSQTSHLIRTIASGGGVNYLSVLILTVYLIAFSIAASWFIYKKKICKFILTKNHRLSCSFGKPVIFLFVMLFWLLCV